jgi:HNH endonuclease
VTISEIIADLDGKLEAFNARHEGLELREKVLHLVEILNETRKLNVAALKESGIDSSNARERIRLYMTQFVGVPLDAIELEVVGSISNYGRRIRELRVQDGYQIVSGPKEDEDSGIMLSRNQYLLIRPEPDLTAAHRWHIANRIRKEQGSGRDRILRYLQENVAQIVTTEEIAYVAKIADYPRRIRELRTEEGFAISTCFNGRPDLRPGEYVLESTARVAEPHDRHIPIEVEREVFERDNNQCINCDWHRALWSVDDPRFLEIHHVEHHANRGPNIAANLVVLCNRCHDEVHAGRLVVPPPKI